VRLKRRSATSKGSLSFTRMVVIEGSSCGAAGERIRLLVGTGLLAKPISIAASHGPQFVPVRAHVPSAWQTCAQALQSKAQGCTSDPPSTGPKKSHLQPLRPAPADRPTDPSMACCGTAQGMSVAQKHSPTAGEVKKRKK